MRVLDMPSRREESYSYRPKPVDTSAVDASPLEHLGGLLARNCHDMWALERLKQGWQYGPTRDDAAKKHPCLVPYVFLTDDEQEYDVDVARETLKTLLAMRFSIIDQSTES